MTTALYAPLPLPLDRLRPGVGLLVVALHVGLLWVANLYWPLQSVLFSAVQNTAQSITVQILQKTANRNTADAADKAALSATQQAISNPSRQRFGRAETMLDLPAPQTEASTPLASTVQTVQTAQTAPSAKAEQANLAKAAPAPAPSLPVANAEPAPQRTAPSVPVVPAAPAQRSVEEKLPEPAPPVANTAPPPLANTVPPSVPTSVPPAAAPSAAVAAPVPTPLVVAAPSLSPAANSLSATSATVAAPGAAASAGSAAPGFAAPGLGNAGAAQAPTGINAPLNLNLPPRYIYRPPIYVPRRSLSEMANDQLRRKPRDPFAEGIEGAGNIDCLKETPEGPAQGLLAIGPLLKRAIEEKCRK
jgi:hypothetical protein